MKKQSYFLAMLMGILFMACQKQTQSDISTANNTSHDNLRSTSLRSTSLSAISLNVIINNYTDASANGVLCMIKSENGQQYVDGVDYVKAVIDQNGNFYFNTNTSKNTLAKRFVVYDLSYPVAGASATPGFARGYYKQYNYIFSTGSTQYGTIPFIPLQNLGIGLSECIYMNNNINGDGVNSIFKYTVKFHSSTEDNSITPTAFAIVTRVSDIEWKIEPGSCSSTNNNIAALWTGDTRNEIIIGYYHLPFFFTLIIKK